MLNITTFLDANSKRLDKNVLYKLDANGTIEEVWDRLLEIVNS